MKELEGFYEYILNCLTISSKNLINDTRKYTHKPGWSDYVSDLYEFSRETYSIWVENGKPRQGPIHSIYTQSKRRFKYALRFIKKNENALRRVIG